MAPKNLYSEKEKDNLQCHEADIEIDFDMSVFI